MSLTPETFLFKDDGSIPNSNLLTLFYKNAFAEEEEEELAALMEERFAINSWTNSWRNGIYDFHHYHSNTHEVLGVYQGHALLQLGGEQGRKLWISQGDVLILPAGVGHKKLESENLGVIGASPRGLTPDLFRGYSGERPEVDLNIEKAALPEADPLLGKNKGLVPLWYPI